MFKSGLRLASTRVFWSRCTWLTVSGGLFLSRSLEDGCGRIGPGQELVETALGMAVDDAADHVGQVGPGLDADKLASLNQRRKRRPGRGAAVRAREESIFPGESQRAHAALDHVGVDLNPAVGEEQ